MKNFMKKMITVLGISLVTVGVASAALPAVVSTTLTGIQTDGMALVDLIWPVVGAITGAFILFKLFKRGSSKI